jgi:multicomponent Na+:H+ antiporter subunit C
MTMLPWLIAAWLFGIGSYGIVTGCNNVHLVGCLSVVHAATKLLAQPPAPTP